MKNETLEKYEKGKILFEQGDTLTDIAKELNIARGRFAEWLRKEGIQTKENKIEKYTKGINLLSEGKSLTQISKELKISARRFALWLREQDIETPKNKKYTCNEDYFKEIDTEEKAYWLGFLYADGCVNRGKKSMNLEITLKNEDRKHLVKFLNAINSNVPIKEKQIILGDKTFQANKIVICSTQMCKDLIEKGCVPNKSLTLEFPSKETIKTELLHHFVRGYFDGDGWLGFSTDKRRARLGITGTYSFLNSIQDYMKWDKNIITKDKRSEACTISYGGSLNSIAYLNQLYKNASYYLDRKYKKYEEIIAVLSSDI